MSNATSDEIHIPDGIANVVIDGHVFDKETLEAALYVFYSSMPDCAAKNWEECAIEAYGPAEYAAERLATGIKVAKEIGMDKETYLRNIREDASNALVAD